MIAGIDSRPAHKDDRALPAQAQAWNAQFSQALTKAANPDPPPALPPARDRTDNGKLEAAPVKRAPAKADPAQRGAADSSSQSGSNQNGSAQNGVAETGSAQSAGQAGKPAGATARDAQPGDDAPPGAPGADSANVPAGARQAKDQSSVKDDAPSVDAAQAAGAQALTGAALVIAANRAATGMDRAPQSIEVTIGDAAWRLSPHGAAALNPDPTATPAAIAAAPVESGTPVALQNPADHPTYLAPHLVTVQELVELSKEAQAALRPEGADAALDAVRGQGAASSESAVTLPGGHDHGRESANEAAARNEVLNRIGGNAGAPQPQAPNPQLAALAGEVPPKPVADGEERSKAPHAEHADAVVTRSDGAAAAAQSAAPGAAGAAHGGAVTAGSDLDLVNRIMQQAQWLIRNNRSEVTLQLHPEHLGEVKVHVSEQDGDLSVQLTVDNAAAKHQLEASLNDLRARLQAEHPGGNLMVQVDVRKGDDSGSFMRYAARQQEPAVPARLAPEASEPVPGLQSVRAAGGSSNISIYA